MRSSRGFVFILAFLIGLAQIGLNHPKLVFDTETAYAIIAKLSSPVFEGRICGGKGNESAMAFIAGKFTESRLSALPGASSLRQTFESYQPVLRSTPILQVLDSKHKVVKTYVHRVDFREITSGASASGDVTGRFTAAAGVHEVQPGKNCMILLTNESYTVEDDYALQAYGVKALIIQNPVASVHRKSLSLFGRPMDSRASFVKIFVTPDTMRDLIADAHQGCLIRVKVDLTINRVRTANLVGIIKGASGADRGLLVLSAHLDHIGRDPSGCIFPGALDNASGVAVMLTLLKAMAVSGTRPRKTIVFAALNAEESTLGGSDFLARNWPFDRSNAVEVVNLDMLGAKEVAILSCLIAPEADGRTAVTRLADKLATIARSMGLPFKRRIYASADHTSFTTAGIPAVTLIHDTDVHNVSDNINHISKARLAEAGNLAAEYLAENAY